MAAPLSAGLEATKRDPEDLRKITEHFSKMMDLSNLGTRDFKQEYRSVEAAFRIKFYELADTLEYDPSLGPYLVVVLKSLTQITSDLGSIGDKKLEMEQK
jgi:hypothetical protein